MNFFSPKTVLEASNILKSNKADSQISAGSTWLMRAPLRNENIPNKIVSLNYINDLLLIKENDDDFVIGAMVTHRQLFRFFKNNLQFNCLKSAAFESANESIRNTATIGGNLCAKNFINSDIIPALLSLNAKIIIFDGEKNIEKDIRSFLEWRNEKKNFEIITYIKINKENTISSHKRFLLREAGEYPIANLSVNLKIENNKFINYVSISVGVIEKTAKKWKSFENYLKDKEINIELFKQKSFDFVDYFKSRDDTDCPGWYRLKILPQLVEQSFSELMKLNIR